MAHMRGQIGQGAFAALGGGGPAIVPTDGSEQPGHGGGGLGGGLFFESPPATNALNQQDQFINPRYQQQQHQQQNHHQQPGFVSLGAQGGVGGGQAHHNIESNLTIRVFLRVLNSEEVEDIAPSKLTKDQQQALFKELLEKTPVIGDVNGESGKCPINYDSKDQCYIDIEIPQHLNCTDLMIRTIDCFNEHFREQQSPLMLSEQSLDHYQLYMAKKSGKPNDDFPSIDRTQIVSKVNHTRFALCFDPSAIQQNPSVTPSAKSTAVTLGLVSYSSASATQSKIDPKKRSMAMPILNQGMPQNTTQQQVDSQQQRVTQTQTMGGSLATNNMGDDYPQNSVLDPKNRASLQNKKPRRDLSQKDGDKSCCIVF